MEKPLDLRIENKFSCKSDFNFDKEKRLDERVFTDKPMTTQEQCHVRDKENVSPNTTGKNFIFKLQLVLCIYNLQDFTISE